MICSKCGKPTAYEGPFHADLPCEHCGASHRDKTEEVRKMLTPIMIFFVAALPVGLIFGDEAIVILFPLFIILLIIVCRHHLRQISHQKKEGVGGQLKRKFRLSRRNARQPIKLPARTLKKSAD
tara:strand:+ start:542 stop:913 length:372 start_codon:yes stop_codon:yes gene_type:complete